MIIKIILLAFISTIISVVLKPVKPEYSLMVGIGFTIIFAGMIVEPLISIFSSVLSISDYINGGDEIIKKIIKIISVAYLSDICSEICKSAGESAIAKKVDIGSRIYIAYTIMPVFVTLLDVIRNVI